MDKQENKRLGSYIALWAPNFDAMRIAMDEIEDRIKAKKDQIDPASVETKVCAGENPYEICVSWSATERKVVDERKTLKKPHPFEYVKIDQLIEWHEIAPVVNEVHQKILALAAEKAAFVDKTVFDAIVKAAKEAGVSDLYLFDRDFVVAAIREKMEREGVA